MTVKDLTSRPSRRSETLDELERVAQWLWSTEPIGGLDERFALMTALARVSDSLERMSFRQEFHPDEALEAGQLGRCREQLAELCARWPLDDHRRPFAA